MGQTLTQEESLACETRVLFDVNVATVTSTYFYMCDWSEKKLTFSTLMLRHSGKLNMLRFMHYSKMIGWRYGTCSVPKYILSFSHSCMVVHVLLGWKQ